jgi:hypothetical protein
MPDRIAQAKKNGNRQNAEDDNRGRDGQPDHGESDRYPGRNHRYSGGN